MGNIYERDLYTNDNIDFIISKNITEYDIRNAGFNLIKYYGLLPEDKIQYLSSLSKTQRTIQIGKYERDDKQLADELTKSFKKIRKVFFKENNLTEDNILSIKKDAIFVIGRDCDATSFSNVEFIKKNKYSSYHRFGNIEMYYRSFTDVLHIKGIRDELLKEHEEYFIMFLKKAFSMLEFNDRDSFINYMKRFVNNYKSRNIDIEYYRELSPESVYTFNDIANGKYIMAGTEYVDDDMIDNINISYNYIKYILPLIQRHYFDDK